MDARFSERTRAFTLIEIIITVFIVTLVMAVVLPSFYSLGGKDTASDAKAAASIIRFLNDTSRNTRSEATMVFDLDGGTVSYKTEDKEETMEIRSLYSVELTSEGEKKGGEVTVTFSAGGLMERLRVRFHRNSEYMATVYNPYSGRVMIKKETGPSGSDER